jgi:hypothetical protein
MGNFVKRATPQYTVSMAVKDLFKVNIGHVRPCFGVDIIKLSFSACPDNRRVRRFDNIRYECKVRFRYSRPAMNGGVSMPFDNVFFEVACGFMPKPGKV